MRVGFTSEIPPNLKDSDRHACVGMCSDKLAEKETSGECDLDV